MKKKFKYIIFLACLLIATKSFSKDNCNLFLDELRNNTDKYNSASSTWIYNDFGFIRF